jgi:hypothetical protein
MPLVLVESEVALSGHEYADLTGISYQYPPTYRNKIKCGERFLYYQSRRLRSGTRPQGYFGAGIIGDIHMEIGTSQLRCDIVDYVPFDQLVPFRDVDGAYLERAAEGKPNYWRDGVRQIDNQVYDRIIGAATITTQQVIGTAPLRYSTDPGRALAIERFAVTTIKRLLQKDYPSAVVIEMPRNNPGYDLRVEIAQRAITFVEVKGTASQSPAFFLSEGERAFSIVHADQYKLFVVHAIDLETESHKIATHLGAVPADRLSPMQWRGLL